MKNRTIEEIHDDFGNTAFALLLDNAIKYGRTITNIEEYDEKYKFKMDGYPTEFSKLPYAHTKAQLKNLLSDIGGMPQWTKTMTKSRPLA